MFTHKPNKQYTQTYQSKICNTNINTIANNHLAEKKFCCLFRYAKRVLHCFPLSIEAKHIQCILTHIWPHPLIYINKQTHAVFSSASTHKCWLTTYTVMTFCVFFVSLLILVSVLEIPKQPLVLGMRWIRTISTAPKNLRSTMS